MDWAQLETNSGTRGGNWKNDGNVGKEMTMDKATEALLFLDIDGVLIAEHDVEAHRMCDFSRSCASTLGSVLEAVPQLRVVVSSDWRIGFSLFSLGTLWQKHGLPPDRVIGITPLSPERRGMQIRAWLARHCRTTRLPLILALDDHPEDLAPLSPQQILATDPYEGLTRAMAPVICRRLGGQ